MQHLAAVFVCAFAVACAQRPGSTQTSTVATNGEAPSAEWFAAETNGFGTPATWSVRTDLDGSRSIAVDSDAQSGTFNLLLSRSSHGPDVDLAVRLYAKSGVVDRGGGLVWRAKDANNYYVTRWNPLEDNLRLYKVEGGERTTLASVDAKVDPSEWHDLRVTMIGTSIEVALDEGPRLSFDDATFREAGSIGLWSKADASNSFTFPTVRTLER